MFFFLKQGKLEVLRDLEKAGKDVNADQKAALSKYGEVSQTLEFARDMFKQIQQITTVSEKEQKKKQKKVRIVIIDANSRIILIYFHI